MVNIGIIEEEINRRYELKNYINSQRELVCTYAAASVQDFLSLVTSCHLVMVILISIGEGLGHKSVAQQVKTIKLELPDADIIVLSDQDETALVLDALRAGALGYMAKDTPLLQIRDIIMGVSVGGAYMSPLVARKITDYFRAAPQETFELTKREKEIVDCLTEGYSYKMIASKLFLSLDTVRFHLRNIYKKLRVNSKAEVIAKVLKKDSPALFKREGN
jgi:DNA-binding NarL/FixJ family response regulator